VPLTGGASPGRVYWITGLSGAGKTTLGRELWSRLRAAGRPATFLDGDALRKTISEDLGYSENDRRQSAMRNAWLCRLLGEQGDVVCATVSMFHEVQRWNRKNIPGYFEIYLRVPTDELRRRDSKGLYAAAASGNLRDVVGIDLLAETPESPDLVLDNYSDNYGDNHGPINIGAAVERILAVSAGRNGAEARKGIVAFKTKAESLEALAPLLRGGRVLPQVRISVSDWRSDSAGCLAEIAAAPWGSGRVIARSSARAEDAGGRNSQAGRYTSVLDVAGSEAVARAIGRVIDSFGPDERDDDQVFVQPLLERVVMAGVVFSRSPNGGPYFVVNYDDYSGCTDQVTSGVGENLRTFVCLRSQPGLCPALLRPVLDLVQELETLL
jgi:adenylylsulfate kinase-like enzyme